MLDAIGGRKFLLTLLMIAVGTAVQILSPKGVTSEFTALLVGLSAAFTAGNAFNTVKALNASPEGEAPVDEPAAAPAEPPPQVDLAPIEGRVAEVASAIEQHAGIINELVKSGEIQQKLIQAALRVKRD